MKYTISNSNTCILSELKKGELFYIAENNPLVDIYMKIDTKEVIEDDDNKYMVNAVSLNGDICYYPSYQEVVLITDYKLEIKRN